MVALLILFLISAVAIQMVLTPKELQANGGTALTFYANKLVGPGWGSLAALALVSSTVAVIQTTLLPTARTTLAMGRDGVLGRVWAIIHPVWRTPWIGTLIIGVISGLIAVLSTRLGAINQVVAAGVTSIGLLVAFYYGWSGIACAVTYRDRLRRSARDLIIIGVVPVAGALTLFALAVFLVYQDWTTSGAIAFDATNGKFQVIIPVSVLVTGALALIWSNIRRRYFHSNTATGMAGIPSDAEPAIR
jgi:amino acid transporter